MLPLQWLLELFLTLRSLVLDLYNKGTVIYLWTKSIAHIEIMTLLCSPSVLKSSLIMPQLFPILQFVNFLKEEAPLNIKN